MSTIYDYLSVAIFAGLIVLYLQRSVGETPYRDSLWQYLVASIGCAVSNYLGNGGYAIPAVVLIGGTCAFVFYVLKPFPGQSRP